MSAVFSERETIRVSAVGLLRRGLVVSSHTSPSSDWLKW